MKSAYDIFISYRRKDAQGSDKGVHIARTIKQYLEIKGYKGRVFFDYSELSNEDFDKRILSVIRQAKVFISVLTPDSMLRCVNDGDWVLRELLEAYNNKLQMIFINPDGREIAFPGRFPEELSFVKTRNHLTVHMDSSFERDMDDLIEKHIAPVSAPSDGSNSGKYAKVRVRTDHDCIIKRFDEEIGSAKVGEYSIVYLPKGKHRITFISSARREVMLEVTHEVTDLEYEGLMEVKLKEVYRKFVEDEEKKHKREQFRGVLKKSWIWIGIVMVFAVVVGVFIWGGDDLPRPEPNPDELILPFLAGSKTKSGTINGHEYVDLGLPSGLKWATCNVGASSPEEYGDYYAWGEIETKSKYTEDNSKTYGKSMSDISGNAMYDVARAKWGGNWRMPTMEELEELNSKCTWQWTTQKGINGYKVTGPNGNSIFLPAAGYRYGSSLELEGDYGYYWSSTPDDSNYYDCLLIFSSSYHNVDMNPCYSGLSVRPVLGNQNESNKINGYEYVDLGLPSGLKWATCNVGANSPEEYGNYYAWGEIDTKGEYTDANSKTMGKSMNDISGNSSYDVARAKWGGSWRLPTKKELEELESKCAWELTTQNGKNGYKVSGPNGNSIFLPAAGFRYGSSLDYAGESGDYWSSTPRESNDSYAYGLSFDSFSRYVYWGHRYGGKSVRPVSE